MTTEKKGLDLNRIAVWVALASIMSFLLVGSKYFSNMAVRFNNVDVIEERLDKKIKLINANKDDIQGVIIELYKLKLDLRDEEIKKLKEEIKELKE